MPPEEPARGGLEPGESRPPPPRGWPGGFVSSRADRDAVLVLSRVELVPRDLHALAWEQGSAAACLREVRSAPRWRGRAESAGHDPAEIRASVGACGARVLAAGDPGFPESLLDLHDPPAWLFVRGALPEDARWATVVGARRCSAYGREVATALGRGLGAAGVVVVSGAASGIDGAAHRGALEAHGPTVAVLGSGVDVAYPTGHRRLIAQIASEGAVVSEYPPGTRASRHRFPARNRIVAALGEKAVVVEGALGSGSRITAEFAMDLGREVFGIPGPVTSPLAAVPHELMREGATLARGAADVLESLELFSRGGEGRGASLEGPEARALEVLAGSASTLEEVVVRSGLAAGDALAALMGLELRGLVRTAGGRYERTLAGAGEEVPEVNRSRT